MQAREVVQKIGDVVCEGCGPGTDCGIDPLKCDRINEAIAILEDYHVPEREEDSCDEYEEHESSMPISTLCPECKNYTA